MPEPEGLQERAGIAHPFTHNFRRIGGQIDHRGRLLAQRAAVDNQIDQLADAVLDLFRIGLGEIVARQN